MEKNPTEEKKMELLQSEVASFASSLGLSSSTTPDSGFNDTDFRKPVKKPKKPANRNTQLNNSSKKSDKIQKDSDKKVPNKKPIHKTHFLSVDNSTKSFDKYKNLPKLPLVKASLLGVWHNDLLEFEKKVFEKVKLEMKMGIDEWKSFVEKKKELGERLMWQYSQDYEQSRGKKGEMRFLDDAKSSGTAADKVSAFSILVAENPIANLKSLDALLGMVTSKVGKRHALSGFDSLKHLFAKSPSNALLPDRKLKSLLQRPVNSLPETKDGYTLLLFWYWEDCLKQRYDRFVSALEEASKDMLPVLKDKALKTMKSLLKRKPEQERRLLSALVNKLGDPQDKTASTAAYLLLKLLNKHRNMTGVVIDEVDTFLFRPHLGLKAKYHAVIFLSQVPLRHDSDGSKVAKHLVDVYFALFKVLTAEEGDSKRSRTNDRKTSDPAKEQMVKTSPESHAELDRKILAGLLTGVNRAFPYVSSSEADDIIEVQTPVLFRLVHSDNFNVGIQALMLLDKISSKNQIVSDRFYRALYSKLLLPAAMSSSKAEFLYGLLLRAMKNDVNLKRVSAFAKRLLQMSLQQPPNHACACLMVLSEVLQARPSLWSMVMQNESVDEELEHFEDVAEETDHEPNAAVTTENNAEFVYEADEDNHASDSFEGEDDSPLPSSEDDDSDEAEELFPKDGLIKFQEPRLPSNFNGNQQQISSGDKFLPGSYNPRHREPSYCNADRASWWELTVLASHVHPSVSNMAGTLLAGANIIYNGKPLTDLSLRAFLDKFMEKKPKQTTWHGGSQIEPAKKLNMNNHLIGPEILSLAEVDVPPEDLVFHKFYSNKLNSSKPNKKKKKKKAAEEEAAEELYDIGNDDGVDGGDESDNEEIDNLLDSAHVSFEADGEYNYDDLDQVANEDDDDLIGNASDVEMDMPSDVGEDFVGEGSEDDDEAIEIGDMDDGSDDGDVLGNQKRKRKSGASPFASLEEYAHLLNEESPSEQKSKKKKPKSIRKKKSK